MPAQEVVTPQAVRDSLPTVRLQTRGGDPFPEAFYEEAIHTAVRTLEAKYSIVLATNIDATYVKRLDVRDWDGSTWYLKALPARPVAQAVRLRIRYGNHDGFEMPGDWVVVKDRGIHGRFQIIPGPSTASYPVPTAFGTGYIGYHQLFPREVTPELIELEYRAGFERRLGDVATEDGSAVVTLWDDAKKQLATRVGHGAHLKVGDTFYRARGVNVEAGSITLDSALDADDLVPLVWYDYDPLLISWITTYAGLEAVAAANLSHNQQPGMLSSSLGVDSIAQSKSINSKGPYATQLEWMRQRLKELDAAIHRIYAEVNIHFQ